MSLKSWVLLAGLVVSCGPEPVEDEHNVVVEYYCHEPEYPCPEILPAAVPVRDAGVVQESVPRVPVRQ